MQNAAPDVVKVLAGNKCEAPPTQRVVDKERGMKVRKKHLKYSIQLNFSTFKKCFKF